MNSMRLQELPRDFQEGPKRSQDSSYDSHQWPRCRSFHVHKRQVYDSKRVLKYDQNDVKMEIECSKMDPTWRQTEAKWHPNGPLVGSRWAKRLQNGSKMAARRLQEPPRCPKEDPRWLQGTPRWAQETPRWPHKCPTWRQNRPKTAPKGPNGVPK
jgi:hypothetical protein